MRKAVLKKSFKIAVSEKRTRRTSKVFEDLSEQEEKDESTVVGEKMEADSTSNTSSDLIQFVSPEPETSTNLIRLSNSPDPDSTAEMTFGLPEESRVEAETGFTTTEADISSQKLNGHEEAAEEEEEEDEEVRSYA
jgi:hypothetical protein